VQRAPAAFDRLSRRTAHSDVRGSTAADAGTYMGEILYSLAIPSAGLSFLRGDYRVLWNCARSRRGSWNYDDRKCSSFY